MSAAKKERTLLKEIKKALNAFPKAVAEKKNRYLKRQKFLKVTFGGLVKTLSRIEKK